MPCERRHDESIQAFSVPRPSGLEKRVVFLLSNFAFPLKKRKFEKSTPAPCCRGVVPRMPTAPVDKPAAAR
jgi:hypothetical protein